MTDLLTLPYQYTPESLEAAADAIDHWLNSANADSQSPEYRRAAEFAATLRTALTANQLNGNGKPFVHETWCKRPSHVMLSCEEARR